MSDKNFLFNRQAILIINSKQYNSDDLDFEFNIPFSTENEPDVSEITIYNLSQNTISNIKKGTKISLLAGYSDDVGMILSGEVASFNTVFENVDKKTTLKIGSFINSWKDKKINKTYAKGITAKEIMTDLISNFGVVIADMNIVKNVTYKRGKTVSGRLKDVVKKLCSETESKFYIDKDRAYIRNYDKGTNTSFLLSSKTGLVSSPQPMQITENGKKSKDGFKISCLLNHNIFPDSIIQVDSKNIKGSFRVVKGTHTSDFITTMEVVDGNL